MQMILMEMTGMGQMNAMRFFVMTTLANLGISATYAAIGAWAAHLESFLLAFAAALILPGIAMLLGKRYVRTNRSNKQ